MPDAPKVLVKASCPGCKIDHEIAVNRNDLKNAVSGSGNVELYCIHTDRIWIWHMAEHEKQNMRKALADGAL
ncbi:MAG: hypothetical protein ACHP7I_01515 [Terriglobales bacterium]